MGLTFPDTGKEVKARKLYNMKANFFCPVGTSLVPTSQLGHLRPNLAAPSSGLADCFLVRVDVRTLVESFR